MIPLAIPIGIKIAAIGGIAIAVAGLLGTAAWAIRESGASAAELSRIEQAMKNNEREHRRTITALAAAEEATIEARATAHQAKKTAKENTDKIKQIPPSGQDEYCPIDCIIRDAK